ncbi:MAG TPA: TolC family protein [Polyangiaceae bacterium]|nr:TolC family protein [Polyangiaceae bacterium]
MLRRAASPRGAAATIATLLGALASVVPLLAGCASTSATPGFHEVARTVQERAGYRLRWNQATPEDHETDRAVSRLLARPLTVDGAVQVALLENPSLQAVYEDLALAQADVVQAGLLSNPVFTADITTAEREALDPNLILGVTQSFLDLLLIPAKKKVAAAQFDAARFRVGSAVLDVAAQVKAAFFAAQAAEQALAVRRTMADGEEATFEIARRQAEAGNIGDLAAANEKTLYLEARLEVTRGEAEASETHEKLTRLMGLASPSWRTTGRLPEVPASDPPLDQLEERAVRDRLDLSALRDEVRTLDYALGLAKTSRWTGVIDIGVDVARLKDGHIAVGPRASIELPIFDQRQAPIARLEAQLRKSQDLLAAGTIDARSEVRAARDRMAYARKAAETYRADVIPAREQVVALSQQEYDAMLLGVYQLIAAKQNEVAAYRDYIEAVRDYWTARADLEHAIDGSLGEATPVPGSQRRSTP